MARPITALRLAIAGSGLTQKEIAASAGMDEPKLSRLVNGRHPGDEKTRQAIASVLGVSVEDLFPDAQPLAEAA